jgi:hypothetical protein
LLLFLQKKKNPVLSPKKKRQNDVISRAAARCAKAGRLQKPKGN